jgi:hypothetical protein
MFYDIRGVYSPVFPVPALNDFEENGTLKPTAFFAIRQGSKEFVSQYLSEDWHDIAGTLFYSDNNDNTVDIGALRYAGTFIPVSSVQVTGTDDGTAITVNGGTLQMIAKVQPTNATNKSVIWSITSGTTYAEISPSGLIQAKDNGTVTVRATAREDNRKYDEWEINISGQAQETPLDTTMTGGSEDAATLGLPKQVSPVVRGANLSAVIGDARTPLAQPHNATSAEEVVVVEPVSPDSGDVTEESGADTHALALQQISFKSGIFACVFLLFGLALGVLWIKRKGPRK